ncbi:hypothetical protein DFH08DRAFT_800129 [Mycena albidolilacea]|uniref:Uncharacterized protein n=1 Tax=Mycena albidolilacea TaxID=1033008 RepID=A0AAD7EZ66_9AGAR|nr:hypothetical protein DFH08DRAFT_800129 [Mycena albidolilacea]
MAGFLSLGNYHGHFDVLESTANAYSCSELYEEMVADRIQTAYTLTLKIHYMLCKEFLKKTADDSDDEKIRCARIIEDIIRQIENLALDPGSSAPYPDPFYDTGIEKIPERRTKQEMTKLEDLLARRTVNNKTFIFLVDGDHSGKVEKWYKAIGLRPPSDRQVLWASNAFPSTPPAPGSRGGGINPVLISGQGLEVCLVLSLRQYIGPRRKPNIMNPHRRRQVFLIAPTFGLGIDRMVQPFIPPHFFLQ